MKAIIIGAGRGQRLGKLTDAIPKTLVPILGRPMLEHVLDALDAGDLARDEDVVFVCGYKADVIQQAYPELTYVENDDWPNNNILLSLLHARTHMTEGFVSTYADIVYRPAAVEALTRSPHDITLVVDTDWRRRYQGRTEHPESDAEKVQAEGDRLTRLSRHIEPSLATGEFIGVMRLTANGAQQFLAAFDRARAAHQDTDPFREGRTFQKAYLIDLLQVMIEAGTPLHCVEVHGGYMEIDTQQDASLAEQWWRSAEQ